MAARSRQPWSDLAQQPRFGRKRPQPRIVHAYAGTAYAAQGRTSSAAVMYVGAATDAREVYVGLTRHRHEARVVVERDRLDALCRQRQRMRGCRPPTRWCWSALFREARNYSEKANVIDYAADRVAFVRDGSLGTREPNGQGVDVPRVMRAARLLREAMAWLGVEPLIVPTCGWWMPTGVVWRRHRPGRRALWSTSLPAASVAPICYPSVSGVTRSSAEGGPGSRVIARWPGQS